MGLSDLQRNAFNSTQTDVRKDDDKLFTRRLNFLKSSLEKHESEATTLNQRQNAEESKARRIWELWRKDHEMPKM